LALTVKRHVFVRATAFPGCSCSSAWSPFGPHSQVTCIRQGDCIPWVQLLKRLVAIWPSQSSDMYSSGRLHSLGDAAELNLFRSLHTFIYIHNIHINTSPVHSFSTIALTSANVASFTANCIAGRNYHTIPSCVTKTLAFVSTRSGLHPLKTLPHIYES
jgi:hypothetical protein